MDAILSRFETVVPDQAYVVTTFRLDDADRMYKYTSGMRVFNAKDYLYRIADIEESLNGDTLVCDATSTSDNIIKHVTMCKVLSSGVFLKRPRPIRVLLWLDYCHVDKEPKGGLINFDSVPEGTQQIDKRIEAIEKQMKKQAAALKLREQARFALARKPAAKKP